MKRLKVLMLVISMAVSGFMGFGILAADNLFAAVDEKMQKKVQEAVDEYLAEKTKISGSLDLFDGSITKVRNLKFVALVMETLTGEDPNYEVNGDFRDLSTGDIIDLKISLSEEKRTLSVKDVTIFGLKKKADQKDPEAANKKFTDEEAVTAMKNYIEKMSKFGGTFGLFDQTNEKYRQLKLLKIDEKIRNFGILYISTVDFEDTDTKEKVIVDMTVFNNEGILDIKSIRIKKIIKP